MSRPSENPFRNLIREIHRRSLWQVLGIYLGGSWLAFEIVERIAHAAGLPSWIPPFALILLVIGLPVVLATAYVQEGAPDVTSVDSLGDLDEILAGDESTSGTRTPLERLFNWRNALLGGAAAFVLLTTVALTWMSVARTDVSATFGSVLVGSEDEPTIHPSVAVMPCDDLSPSGDQVALAQGIADEVSMALSQLPDLKVSGRSSVTAMKAQEADLATISSTLGVANVLQCTVVRDGSAVRVNALLTEVETGSVLWSGQFNEEFTDLFGLLDAVAYGLSSELQVALSDDGGTPLVAEATSDPNAHEAYLRGRYLLGQRTPESLPAAISQFERAVELDPEYSEALSGLSESYLLLNAYAGEGQDIPGNVSRAVDAAQRSVTIAPRSGAAQTSMAYALWYSGEWDEAESRFLRAMSLNPSYPMVHHWYAQHLWTTGRAEQSLIHAQTAVELDPVARVPSAYLGIALEVAGRTEEAIRQYRETTALSPSWSPIWTYLGHLLIESGQYEEGVEAMVRSSELLGVEDLEGVREAYEAAARYHRSGDPQSVAIFDSPTRFGHPWLYANTGQPQRAIEELSLLREDGLLGLLALQHALNTGDVLSDDPRYQALLEEAGITW